MKEMKRTHPNSATRFSMLLTGKSAIKWAAPGSVGAKAATELPLYLLRKTALDEALEPFELGRVFYHLSQRRGYRSNRKERLPKRMRR